MKVMILGSSHISNLDAYLRENFDMNLANHEIRITGFRGGMVHTMYTALVDVNNSKPDTVILQIGSNDISDRETYVASVALALRCLYDTLILIHVHTVVVGLSFHRSWVLPKRGLKLYEYNHRVDHLNYLMHDMSLELENMIFWKHGGLQFPTVPVLDKHGVHLNMEGNYRLATSLRGAVLYKEKLRVKLLINVFNDYFRLGGTVW